MIILPSSSFRLSSDIGWRIRDKLRPVPKHSSMLLYVHGNHEARYGMNSPGQHLDSHTAAELWLVRVTDYLVRRPNNPPSTPPPPPAPMLRCTFLRLIKHTFLSSWRVWFFFGFFLSLKKLQWSETFGKLQLTSTTVWTHCEFPLVFHAANTMSCGVAAIVLSQWQCSFFDRLCCINGYS